MILVIFWKRMLFSCWICCTHLTGLQFRIRYMVDSLHFCSILSTIVNQPRHIGILYIHIFLACFCVHLDSDHFVIIPLKFKML